MSEPSVYYRTTDPAVTAWWRDCDRLREEFFDRANAFAAEYDAKPACVRGRSSRGYLLVKVLLEDADGPQIRPGWMKKVGDDFWSPDRRRPGGRALADRMHEIRFSEPDLPGMPFRFYVESVVYWPGLEEIGAETWADWHPKAAAAMEEAGRVDLTIWRRARASEYWTVREAREAAA